MTNLSILIIASIFIILLAITTVILQVKYSNIIKNLRKYLSKANEEIELLTHHIEKLKKEVDLLESSKLQLAHEVVSLKTANRIEHEKINSYIVDLKALQLERDAIEKSIRELWIEDSKEKEQELSELKEHYEKLLSKTTSKLDLQNYCKQSYDNAKSKNALPFKEWWKLFNQSLKS